MSIESEAQKLLKLREALDQCTNDYENQRLTVHNALVNAERDLIEIDGFRIVHVPESTVMTFTKDSLRVQLLNRGIPDAEITAIIAASKVELPRDSILRITKLKAN